LLPFWDTSAESISLKGFIKAGMNYGHRELVNKPMLSVAEDFDRA
jgi:hypothetical protein